MTKCVSLCSPVIVLMFQLLLTVHYILVRYFFPVPTKPKTVRVQGDVSGTSATVEVELPDLYERIDGLKVRIWEGNTSMPANPIVK